MSKRSSLRASVGMTMIEMVVTLAIISIVSVGLMSLLWVNSWWVFKLSNKTDNLIAAQQFLDRFSAELRMASAATVTSSASSPYQTVVVKIPVFESNRIGNDQYLGYPIQNSDVLTYQVLDDPSSEGQFVVNRSVSTSSGPINHPEDGRQNINAATILTGIVGPLGATSKPKLFTTSATVSSITTTVEMKRSTGQVAGDPMSVRSQVFLRNRGNL